MQCLVLIVHYIMLFTLRITLIEWKTMSQMSEMFVRLSAVNGANLVLPTFDVNLRCPVFVSHSSGQGLRTSRKREWSEVLSVPLLPA